MRAKRSIKDSLKEYLNWCVGRLLLGGSRDDTVRDMVDAISDEIASGGGGVSQDQLDQTVKDVTKAYGIADQTVLTSAEQYTDQKIADVVDGSPEALDTLYELAKALGEDPNFATTVMDLIGQKLPTTTFEDFVTNKAWTKDNLTKLSQLVNDLHSLKVSGHSVDLVKDKLYLDNVDEFFNTKNLTSLSQLINDINSIKAGTRVESMDVNLASISSYLEYDLFDNNTTGTKPPGLTTGFLLTFSWDNGGWGAQIATSDGNVDGAIFLRTIKASESDKIWGPWVSLYNTANFNPDSKLNYNGFNGDLNTISTSRLYRLVSGCTNTPNSGSSQGCHIIHTNWDTNAAHQLYFEYYGSMFYRYKHGGEWSDWKRVWTEFEFNPDSKFNNLGQTSDSNNVVGNGYTLKELGATFSGPFLKWGLPGHMFEFFSDNRINEIQIRHMSQGVWGDPVIMYHSGNFNPSSKLDKSVWDEAFELKTVNGVRVISAKLDGLSGHGLNIPAYIFPGDPSKLDSSASSTHITPILGTAIDLLDAFNNGRVFISKTVTLNEVQVPSDITYSLLKSIDPDNPTIFQIIMSTVVWGHYIEITIDFENNEYQAISNTINGIIGVNNTGTTN